MNRVRLFFLLCRELVLEAEIDRGHALLENHKERLDYAYDELRRVKSRIAAITPASNLLMQALKRKNA